MRITDVDVIHLRVDDIYPEVFSEPDGSYDSTIVIVHTDDAEITGLSETDSFPLAIRALVLGPSAHLMARGLREILVGQDPLEPETLWELMYRSTSFIGRRGLVMHAISAIDIALWDIKGKVEGKPACQMIAPQAHDRIPVYASIYPLDKTPEAVSQQMERAQGLHLKTFKLIADPWWHCDPTHTRELLRTVRESAGREARIIVDAAGSYDTADEGLRFLELLQELNPWFLEAPLPLDDLEGHRRMMGQGVPLGVGDLGLTHVSEFVDMMDRGLVDICQPDITMVGGFTGMRRIADAARERHKRLIPHGYRSNIQLGATLHFMATRAETEIVEYSVSHSPLRWHTTNEAIPIAADGTVAPPPGPGLGVSLNEETVAKYAKVGEIA
jgi:L-alanine-DL-glutamate epimerase-like enolase superfamily enzyme